MQINALLELPTEARRQIPVRFAAFSPDRFAMPTFIPYLRGEVLLVRMD